MRAHARALDWSLTSLGPVETWPDALCAAARLVLDSPSAMCLYAGADFVMLCNDAYAKLLGAQQLAAFGQPAADVWPEMWAGLSAQFGAVTTRGEGFVFRRTSDAHTPTNATPVHPWGDYTLGPVRDGGDRDDPSSNVAILAVVTASPAHVQADHGIAAERAELRSLISHMPVPMALHLGPEHRYELANEAYETVSGRRGLVGQTPREAFPEFASAGYFEILDHVYATGEAWVGPENHVPLQTPTGETRDVWTSVRVEPVRDAVGHVIGLLNMSVDITAQVLARHEVERLMVDTEAARAAAVAANQSKGEFLAIMSHELRTPLNAIDGYAELMELGIRGPTTAEQRQDLGRIRKSHQHLMGLINGLLQYAQVEAGAVHYATEAVPLDEVLATCEALTVPQARASALTLRRQPCDPSILVRADREKLQQVVLNVLSNAIKFTQGGRVEMRWERTRDARGPIVQVRIADTGIGIPADQLGRIFEPFVQVESGLTHRREGTGLGLAISRDLARGMGGDLTVESTLGAGSTFTLTLRTAEEG